MNEKNFIKLEYEILQNDFTRAGEASSNIKKILKQLGIEAKIVRKVAIATYEAEMNIVIHSYGGMIKVIITEQYVDIYAIDKGPGIKDIELAMKEGYSTAPNHIRELGFGAGMGLPNMKRCSDEFNIESIPNEKTEVYMRIYINKI
ncbi:ATP-binding protein [Caloranaerobacter azorensis]|uniref:Anti-sigma regulatory factor (Ser/Thr protein kinase) n=3 Tax=Caloranaerobacter azorensis TaxID=116090 RepID=A0A1M5UEC6_9FIRM|nr:ATP-binding protein [Caloranaerobacter azorensis]KGG81196.1 anti-sigma regulatory factor [Caloranaerobacter azorensis H53214]QIB26610.1 anti-sigma regulatory factor [Caloranaerobacter azorensis]SHH61186.1 Anti-sigma regulatory factor (Ser/Thr protein kinase) [Caloranaerobacter azorensis DSM 13643]